MHAFFGDAFKKCVVTICSNKNFATDCYNSNIHVEIRQCFREAKSRQKRVLTFRNLGYSLDHRFKTQK